MTIEDCRPGEDLLQLAGRNAYAYFVESASERGAHTLLDYNNPFSGDRSTLIVKNTQLGGLTVNDYLLS